MIKMAKIVVLFRNEVIKKANVTSVDQVLKLMDKLLTNSEGSSRGIRIQSIKVDQDGKTWNISCTKV